MPDTPLGSATNNVPDEVIAAEAFSLIAVLEAELSAVRVTLEPVAVTPLLNVMSVPLEAVPVRDSALVAVTLPAAVTLVPVSDIDATDVADEEEVTAPPLDTVTFSPDAKVPSVRALAPAL